MRLSRRFVTASRIHDELDSQAVKAGKIGWFSCARLGKTKTFGLVFCCHEAKMGLLSACDEKMKPFAAQERLLREELAMSRYRAIVLGLLIPAFWAPQSPAA